MKNLFRSVRRWFYRTKEEQRQAGFNWAKNTFESGELTLDEIEAYISGQGLDEFDSGAEDFLRSHS